jgi:LytS/YehU family sensor histidine kinase
MYAISIKSIYYFTSNILHKGAETVLLSWFIIGIDSCFGTVFLIFLFFYLNNYLVLQEQKRAVEQRQAMLNQTILDAELMGLKNQINPHFIYNTLNFMYAQALGSSQELSKSILLLSEIMYYNIKGFNNKNHIPLSIEIKHIQNIIQLQNIKYHHALNIMLDTNGSLEFRRISHLSIAIFIENAIDFVVKRKNSKKILFNINVYEDVLTLYVNFDLKESITVKEKQHIFQEAQDKLKEIYHNRATFQFNNTKLDSIQYTTTVKL